MEPAGRPAPAAVPLPDLGLEPGLVEPFRRGTRAAHPRVPAGRPADRDRALLPAPPRDARAWPLDAAAPRLGREWTGERPHRTVGAALPGGAAHRAARDPGRLAPGPSLEHRPHPRLCRAGAIARLDGAPHCLS